MILVAAPANDVWVALSGAHLHRHGNQPKATEKQPWEDDQLSCPDGTSSGKKHSPSTLKIWIILTLNYYAFNIQSDLN